MGPEEGWPLGIDGTDVGKFVGCTVGFIDGSAVG